MDFANSNKLTGWHIWKLQLYQEYWVRESSRKMNFRSRIFSQNPSINDIFLEISWNQFVWRWLLKIIDIHLSVFGKRGFYIRIIRVHKWTHWSIHEILQNASFYELFSRKNSLPKDSFWKPWCCVIMLNYCLIMPILEMWLLIEEKIITRPDSKR